MKKTTIFLVVLLFLLTPSLRAQDHLSPPEIPDTNRSILGGKAVTFRLGMLMGTTTEKVRIKDTQSNVEGFRIRDSGFFKAGIGILLGLEAELLLGNHLGVRFQPTMSILEGTYHLIDQVGTTSPFNIGRSSIGLPLHLRVAPWGREKGFYGFAGGRWRIDTGRGEEARPFELERTNLALESGFGYTIQMARGSLALEATYSHGVKDQFPTSVSLQSGEPDGIYHDRLLFAVVFR